MGNLFSNGIEQPIKNEQPIKKEQPIKNEQPIKKEQPIKNEQPIEIVKSKVNSLSFFIKEKDYNNRTISLLPKYENNNQINAGENQSIQNKIVKYFSYSSEEKVIDLDDDRREKVDDVDKYPFSTIGILHFSDHEGNKGKGTGTLIAENIVLTCAHNVFDRETGEEYTDMFFVVRLKEGKPRKEYCSNVLKCYFPKNDYIENKYEDYAILILESNIEKYCGFMGIAYNYNLEENKEYNLYGFPKLKDKRSLLY